MITTTNTIKEYYSSQILNQHYLGLQEAYETAMMYTIDMYSKNQPFSTIIKNMPEHLGYTLHPESFYIVYQKMEDMVKDTAMQESFYNTIKNADDIGFYNIDANTLELKPHAYSNYVLIEYKYNSAYVDTVPIFKLADTSIPAHTKNQDDTSTPDDIINQEDTRIILSTPEPASIPSSGYTTEFHFDSENKKILLYTIIAFLAIKTIAYYYKDDSEKLNENSSDEALNSAYETSYLDAALLTNILLTLIPISIVIIYKLRYYYFYKFPMLIKK